MGTVNATATSATANITDDDAAALMVSIANPVDGTEGTSDITYTVSLDGGVTNNTGSAITGTVVLTGTATNGADYTDVTTFSIADGTSSGTITVLITDDTEVEITETLIATITAPSIGIVNATAGNASATIFDNDTAIITIVADTTTDEAVVNRSFILSTSNIVDSDVLINYTLSGVATAPSDYTDVSAVIGTVTIPAGATSAMINLNVNDDNLVEPNETIIAVLNSVTNNTQVTADVTPATLTIVDNDEVLVSITADADTDEAIVNRQFTISLAQAAAIDVAVDYTFTGTATIADDYSDLGTGSVSILAGQTTASVALNIVDDNLVEGSETIIATISSSLSAVTITQAVATLSILDNDECITPINLEVTDVQITTVDLSWSMPANVFVEGYEWAIFEAGADPLTATPVDFNFTLTGEISVDDVGVLVKDTDYDFYVRSMCSSVATSAFEGPISFTTLPDNDGDGIPDGLDPDDDNDGTPDSEEGSDSDDCDNDGIKDSFDPDPCTISAQDIATAFTPNGDGINDTWVIQGIENFQNSIVNVYNRQGRLVFDAKGYQNDWGGIYRENSDRLPPASYYFVVDLKDGSTPIDGWLFINY